MKIVFMGTPQFSVPSLKKLVELGHEVAAAVTQPDRQSGRGFKLMPPPVKQAAQELGIPVLQYARIKSPEGVAELRELAPDIIVTAAFGQILSREILGIPPLGCVNVHASLLPKYRGAAPIQWAIIRGEMQTGVTIMYMNEGLDTGDIISSVTVPIDNDTTGGQLYDLLAEKGANLLGETMKTIENRTAKRTPQNEAESSYFPPLTKALGKIDWDKPARDIRNLIRALDPVMGAYSVVGGDTVKLWSADIMEGVASSGEIVYADAKEGLIVGTGEGLLHVKEMQAPGGKRMAPEAFFRGRTLPGKRFE